MTSTVQFIVSLYLLGCLTVGVVVVVPNLPRNMAQCVRAAVAILGWPLLLLWFHSGGDV